MQTYISRNELLKLLDISGASLNREIKENDFPKPVITGNNHHFETALVYKHLSKLAGRPVPIGDKLKSSTSLSELFNKSSSFIWYTFQKNSKRKAKAIYLRSRPYWLESEIYADKELVKYLEVAEKVAI